MSSSKNTLPFTHTPKQSQQSSQQKGKTSVIAKQVLKNNPIPQNVDQTATKGKQQPLRSTKVSQKLVLFPQAETESTMQATIPNAEDEFSFPDVPVDRRGSYDEGWQPPALAHAAGVPLPVEWTFGSRTVAERMPKDDRDLSGLPRVAAYCTGEGYALTRLRTFLKQHHHVTPRLYDECLYAAYHFPLLTLRPDKENLFNIRVRSASPRQPAAADDEDMNYDEDHLQNEPAPDYISPRPGNPYPLHSHPPTDEAKAEEEWLSNQERSDLEHFEQAVNASEFMQDDTPVDEAGPSDQALTAEEYEARVSTYQDEPRYTSISAPATPVGEGLPTLGDSHVLRPAHKKPFQGGEVFVFDYGVVVFWNFHRAEELLMLEDLLEFSVRPFRDNPDEDMQIEEMHFQYDTSQLKPRIFNDMITLKTGNHMIKLTLSHGLSQSAVLARYEDIMDKTIEDTKHLPKEMAQTGRLDKNRSEITKINGELFALRMNVNLVSNVLDTPEIFWSEPSLKPMYSAIREYLEIPQRAKILNDRLRVISDLLSMLRDHLTNFGVEYQTLIIIYLIIIAVIVACSEIAVKILQSLEV